MCGCTIGAGNFEVFLPQNGENYGSGTFPTFGIEVVCAYLLLVLLKTHTVRVRVPYLHCTGAARTQILDFMDTNTLRDTQIILKKSFCKLSDLL